MVGKPRISGVSASVWYGLVGIAAIALITCLLKPRYTPGRITLGLVLPLIILPEFGYGKIEHISHLFLLAHFYAMFLPIGRPEQIENVVMQAEAVQWYQGGLLAIYSLSGLSKFVDMTIRDLIKPGMTWLHPDALVITSVTSMRGYDFSLAIPRFIESIDFVFPIAYVVLAFILTASVFAAFRRPLLLLVVPTIAVFHLWNAISIYVLFLSTIVVLLVVLWPYDLFISIESTVGVPVQSTRFESNGNKAQYVRTYQNGDTDEYSGFYAFRERMRDSSTLLAIPFYYPGVAWIGTRIWR